MIFDEACPAWPELLHVTVHALCQLAAMKQTRLKHTNYLRLFGNSAFHIERSLILQIEDQVDLLVFSKASRHTLVLVISILALLCFLMDPDGMVRKCQKGSRILLGGLLKFGVTGRCVSERLDPKRPRARPNGAEFRWRLIHSPMPRPCEPISKLAGFVKVATQD